MQKSRSAAGHGFTLVELLVVVAIMGLLIAILVPSLGQARAAGKVAVCGSNLRQIGAAIHAYAMENRGLIPHGPKAAELHDFSGNHAATNRLWIGEGGWGPSEHTHQFQGLGILIPTVCPEGRVFFCPADDNFNLQHEFAKIETREDAYGSYLYRQLDHLPPGSENGVLEQMGENLVDGQKVPVEALALDTNSLGPGPAYHTNHDARLANVLYRDASVQRFTNRDDCLAIPEEAFLQPFPALLFAIDQLLTNVDDAYRTRRPSEAPRVSPP